MGFATPSGSTDQMVLGLGFWDAHLVDMEVKPINPIKPFLAP